MTKKIKNQSKLLISDASNKLPYQIQCSMQYNLNAVSKGMCFCNLNNDMKVEIRKRIILTFLALLARLRVIHLLFLVFPLSFWRSNWPQAQCRPFPTFRDLQYLRVVVFKYFKSEIYEEWTILCMLFFGVENSRCTFT